MLIRLVELYSYFVRVLYIHIARYLCQESFINIVNAVFSAEKIPRTFASLTENAERITMFTRRRGYHCRCLENAVAGSIDDDVWQAYKNVDGKLGEIAGTYTETVIGQPV